MYLPWVVLWFCSSQSNRTVGEPIWSRAHQGGHVQRGWEHQGSMFLHLFRWELGCNTCASSQILHVKMIIFQIPVQMMNMEEELHSYYDQGINTTVLQLPFNNSYSMLLLLPDDMAVLENDISRGHVTKWLKWMRPRLGESKIILKFLVSNIEVLY